MTSEKQYLRRRSLVKVKQCPLGYLTNDNIIPSPFYRLTAYMGYVWETCSSSPYLIEKEGNTQGSYWDFFFLPKMKGKG